MNKDKTLLQKFIEYNGQRRLAGRKKRCLLAVSGGVDSMVMCHLFWEAGFTFAIAHCNFNLRGGESDGDEQLVKTLAQKYHVEVFTKSFNTARYAGEKGISIQLAARELRYAWFEELRKEKGFSLVCTAHQLNDNIETIFYNLIKGTGIRGLRGIPARQQNIGRPLLFATRGEIAQYQKQYNIDYREDSSNASDKYTRNKIRHLIIPLMKEINPGLEKTLGEKIPLFEELEALYEKEVQKPVKGLFLQRGNDIYIPIARLKKTKNAATVLFEYLKEFGFNAEQVGDILGAADAMPGKQFVSGTARIIKDRRFFILTRLTEKNFSTAFLNRGDTVVELPNGQLKVWYAPAAEVKITPDKSVAFIDAGKLEFPLTIRLWKQGDYFYPLGMGMKKKKLKKFFTDQKVALNEKESTWVIETNQRIVWVVGHRMDERFKVTPGTESVVKIQFKVTGQ